MDQSTFLHQLALVLAGGQTTLVKRGSTYVLSNAKDRVTILQNAVPWFDDLYKLYKNQR